VIHKHIPREEYIAMLEEWMTVRTLILRRLKPLKYQPDTHGHDQLYHYPWPDPREEVLTILYSALFLKDRGST